MTGQVCIRAKWTCEKRHWQDSLKDLPLELPFEYSLEMEGLKRGRKISAGRQHTSKTEIIWITEKLLSEKKYLDSFSEMY